MPYVIAEPCVDVMDRRVWTSARHVADNIRFFAEPLPGRDEPVGQPGGDEDFGAVGVDTELVQDIPPRGAD
jgi:hypothetical protein